MAEAEKLQCVRCGDDHTIVECPYVKAVEYDPTGHIITRVEFLTPMDYPQKPIAEEGAARPYAALPTQEQ